MTADKVKLMGSLTMSFYNWVEQKTTSKALRSGEKIFECYAIQEIKRVITTRKTPVDEKN